MTGLEFLPKAKVMRSDVPVIMITAHGDADTKRKALEDGAEALLTKPIDFAASAARSTHRSSAATSELRHCTVTQPGFTFELEIVPN